MDQKWQCNKAAGGARAPPGSFPRCLPLRGRLCGLSRLGGIPAPPSLQSGPAAACEPGLRQDRRTLEPLGRRGYGGRFRCGIKRWRLFAASADHTAPQCGSGQGVTGVHPRSHFQAPAPLVAPLYRQTPVSKGFRWRRPGASEIIEQEGDEPYSVG